MNRAERRRAAHARRKAGLRELTETAHGAFSISIVWCANILDFIGKGMAGDPHAQTAFQAIGGWLSSAGDLEPGERHQCLICRSELTMPDAFAVVTPFAAAGPPVVAGICVDCVTGTADLQAAAIRELGSIWPGLREIEGGCA